MTAWDDAPGRAHLPVPGERDWRTNARERWRYTPAFGESIALMYAESVTDGMNGEPQRSRDGGLWGLHHAMPETYPPPSVVRAWCAQYPAFGLLMRQAEELRAERLMEETVVLADTSPLAAPRVALQIATRQRLAESLSNRYGKPGAASPHSGGPVGLLAGGEQPTAIEVSDEALERLVAASLTAGGGEPPA